MSVPLVSIGMPAYNSEQTIRSALDCMLAQTLQDFELIVSDNASTDGTWDIVQEYARRDPRVRGIRQPYNTGANTNYSLAFGACAWTLLQVGFIERLVRAGVPRERRSLAPGA